MAMALLNDATNMVATTGLGQQLIEGVNTGLDQLLLMNGIDSLNVQDLHQIIVQEDDYQKQMEELQKKLKELEEEKER